MYIAPTLSDMRAGCQLGSLQSTGVSVHAKLHHLATQALSCCSDGAHILSAELLLPYWSECVELLTADLMVRPCRLQVYALSFSPPPHPNNAWECLLTDLYICHSLPLNAAHA